ncbi:hypothetical protein ACFL9U_15435 [Thermodesulfobacteriota bacterium]
MPRKSRIDAPGALHHIISRGIERSEIFPDDIEKVAARVSDLPGIKMTELSRKFKLSIAEVSLSVKRGEKIARENSYSFVDY